MTSITYFYARWRTIQVLPFATKINTTIVRKTLVLLGLLLLASLLPSLTFAHPGGTASDGCHYCRTNCAKWGEVEGARHCHGGGDAAPAQEVQQFYEAPVNTQKPWPTWTPAPTRKPLPTWTPYPTRKPLPTRTPIPTSTPIPSKTPVPSSTLTPSPTLTPAATTTAKPVTPTKAAQVRGIKTESKQSEGHGFFGWLANLFK